MGFYVPNTEKQQREMLMDIGLDNFDELFSQIPEEVLLSEGLDIPRGMSEIEVSERSRSIQALHTGYREQHSQQRRI